MGKLTNKLSSLASTAKFEVKKHAPEILLVAGIVAGIGAMICAIKETETNQEILEEHEAEKGNIEYARDMEMTLDENGDTVAYTLQDYKKDNAMLTLMTTGKLIKHYAPAIGLSALSLTCILYSHGILKSRNVAITAAYNALDGAFRKYRDGVIETYGEEVDKNLKLGRTVEKKEITEVGKNGKEKTVIKNVASYKDPSKYSDFARFFDETNPCWKKDPQYNLAFLKAQQERATYLLNARGYLFLNEVYESIGIDPTMEGQAVGWAKVNPNDDGFVDFGLYDIDSPEARNFINGVEPAILLDFNVDGVIWDCLPIGTGNPLQDTLDYNVPKLEDWEDTDKYIK